MLPGTHPSALFRKHERKLRFVLVGVWNTVFGYCVFLLLDSLFLHILSSRRLSYMIAMLLSYIVSVLNAFALHKFFTFRSRVRGLAVLGELARFSSTYLSVLFLSLVLLPALVEILGLSTRVAGAVVILVCTVTSYLGHSRFSFRNTSR
ncbi:MAG: GtrA family protein [Deltaproteobacteria bacterium]|nr:GtrA family protein [Deltaproteobacteria bacterium]